MGKAPSKPAVRPVATFDHLRKKQAVERTVRIVMSQDAADAHREAVEALARAEQALFRVTAEARKRNGSGGPEAEAAVAAATAERDAAKERVESAVEELRAQTVTLRFRAIGRPRYDALVRAHPGKDTVDDAGETVKTTEPYDVDTFAPALIAASCVEPKMSEAQVMALCDLERLEDDDLRQIATDCGVVLPDGATHAEEVEAVREVAPEWNAAEVMELWIAALSVNTQRRVADFANFSNGTRG